MSVLDRFEKSVEGAVNGVFAKFGSKDLKPVDLSSALEREIDKEAMPVTRDRTVAPNEYRFKLSTPDFNNIVEWGAETLANELADNLTQYAKSQNYAFVGPVVVIFEEDLELSKGDYRLSSESVQGNTVPVTTDAQTEDCPMLEIGEHQYLLTEEKTIKPRAHRRKERAARKAVESPAPVAAAAPSASAATNAKPTLLVIIDGPLAGSSVPLAGNTITLGRSASNTVVLDDEFVSSHHARVYTDPATGRWAIEDLGSTNGTVVNHQRLVAPMILGARVPVRIGATTFELR